MCLHSSGKNLWDYGPHAEIINMLHITGFWSLKLLLGHRRLSPFQEPPETTKKGSESEGSCEEYHEPSHWADKNALLTIQILSATLLSAISITHTRKQTFFFLCLTTL